MKNKQPESEDQQALIKWFDLQYPKITPPLFAVPNASKCPVWVGARFNREGRRKGAPDLLLLVPRGGFNGLAIEMKSLSGKASAEQIEFLNQLAENGYMAGICKGFEQAKQTIDAYLAY